MLTHTPITLNNGTDPAVAGSVAIEQQQKKTIRQRIAEMEIYASKKIIESPPLIRLNSEGIIWRKTINIIQGKFGSHKSRLAELICSLLLSSNHCTTNFIGLTRNELYPCAVAYVDTERNKSEQFAMAIQKVRSKAGFEATKPHPKLTAFSLLDSQRKDRLADLKEFIRDLTSETNEHLFILLDVVTDCIGNFNDAAETLTLFDYLNQLINDFDITFLLVIHENPGSDKARGHTGTEAANKASTIIQISYEKGSNGKETELIKLKFIKLRSGKKPNDLFLRYCPVERGLVLAEAEIVEAFVNGKPKKADMKSMVEALQLILFKPLELQEVLHQLKGQIDASDNTFKKRMDQLIEDRVPFFNAEGIECRLARIVKTGKTTTLFLEPNAKAV